MCGHDAAGPDGWPRGFDIVDVAGSTVVGQDLAIGRLREPPGYYVSARSSERTTSTGASACMISSWLVEPSTAP